MPAITFKNDYASAVLTTWGDGTATLSNLYSRLRGHGHARNLVETIVEYADEMNLTVTLVAQRYGKDDGIALDNKALRGFYESFGFEKVAGERGIVSMKRAPSQNLHGL